MFGDKRCDEGAERCFTGPPSARMRLHRSQGALKYCCWHSLPCQRLFVHFANVRLPLPVSSRQLPNGENVRLLRTNHEEKARESSQSLRRASVRPSAGAASVASCRHDSVAGFPQAKRRSKLLSLHCTLFREQAARGRRQRTLPPLPARSQQQSLLC